MLTDNLSGGNLIAFVNPAFTLLTGYTADEVVGRNCRFLQGPDTDQRVVAELRAAIAAGEPIRRDLLNYRKDGTTFWNEVAIDPIRGRRGIITGYVAVQRDITHQYDHLVARLEAETRFATLVDALPGFLFEQVLQEDGSVVFSCLASAATRAMGLPSPDGFNVEALSDWTVPEDLAAMQALLQQSARDMTPVGLEFRLGPPVGPVRWFRAASSPRLQPGGCTAWTGLALDVTAEKSSQTHADYLTSHDPLTSLLNRPLFRAALARAMTSLGPETDHTALFQIDLDEFQAVNDTLGLPAGDRVLRRVGLRLSEIAEANGGVSARLGGDEFAVLVPGLASPDGVPALAESIRSVLGQPMWLDGQEVIVTACVGAAAFPRISEPSQSAAGDEWAGELMQRAQVALLAAKREGAGMSRVYTPALDDRFRHRQALRQSLHRAINEDQFILHYQPQVALDSGALVGLEALVRWKHPEYGMQRPDLFIPMAEASGLIVPLGASIMRMAMRQQRIWARRGLAVPRLAVNVSSVQLRRPGFIAMVESALRETGAQPQDFELELTESTLLDSTAAMHEQLTELKRLGFTLAIDDFGVGHSTFKYLRDFPVDRLKIDQTFIRQLVVTSNDGPIIRAMLSLARTLELEVVAEGIETTMQRDFLLAEGCRMGQGYLFSPPVPSDEIGRMLDRGARLPMEAAMGLV